jgi:cell division topological specificity factor
MALLDTITRIFMKDSGSKAVATERLRLVLVHDRSSISPGLINALKEDLIKVIKCYMEVDEDLLQVSLENEDDSVALVANIPIKGFNRVVNE